MINSISSITNSRICIPITFDRNRCYVGKCSYKLDAIDDKISKITHGDTAYLHGSNSSSLETFTNENQEIRGRLLPRSILTAAGIKCESGECQSIAFRNNYGEDGHSNVFSHSYTPGEISSIDNTLQYTRYGTEENNRFPVLYVLSNQSPFKPVDQREFTSSGADGIKPEYILGIIVPRNEMNATCDKLRTSFPHIEINSFE